MPRRTRWCGSTIGDVLAVEEDAPAVGRSMPVSRLMNVVLPAPFGPISAWRAPFSICSDTSFVATMPPKFFAEADRFERGVRHADGRACALRYRLRRANQRAHPLAQRLAEIRRRRQTRVAAMRLAADQTRSSTSTRPSQNCQYCGRDVGEPVLHQLEHAPRR